MTIQIASEKTLLRHSQIVEIRRERIEKKGFENEENHIGLPNLLSKSHKTAFYLSPRDLEIFFSE